MLGTDGQVLKQQPKMEILTQNCEMSAVKHSIEISVT